MKRLVGQTTIHIVNAVSGHQSAIALKIDAMIVIAATILNADFAQARVVAQAREASRL
jgi:hypothetical protein